MMHLLNNKTLTNEHATQGGFYFLRTLLEDFFDFIVRFTMNFDLSEHFLIINKYINYLLPIYLFIHIY